MISLNNTLMIKQQKPQLLQTTTFTPKIVSLKESIDSHFTSKTNPALQGHMKP